MAMIVHAVMNASPQLWKVIPQYSVRPTSVAEAVAGTGHGYLMLTVVLWVAAIVVVLVYADRATSRAAPGRS